ncbi:MAG TPA: extracellular solute-binding protein [Stellaceae bacterium]|jgi:iron(III) transport system substrate-binding protein|nr:extracellular solute-binding protein [Stellaceae bacterium]
MTSIAKWLVAALCTLALLDDAHAQDANSAHPWMVPKLLAAAKAEGSVTVYGAINEQEALPFWHIFETETGIHVVYIRASDSQINGRIAIEHRAGTHSWDVVSTTVVMLLPPSFLADLDLPEAAHIEKGAIGPGGKWYGVTANYNSAAYNTKLVQASKLPKSFEDLPNHADWAGKIAIEGTDSIWLKGFFQYYGEERATDLLTKIVRTLKPVIADGHLALARSVAAGEYVAALNNYDVLTLNQKIDGGPTDILVLQPVILSYGQVGIAADAPHPNAARLIVNFMLSREGQIALSKGGRIPVRADAMPPGLVDPVKKLTSGKVVTVTLTPADQKTWQTRFNQIFKAH